MGREKKQVGSKLCFVLFLFTLILSPLIVGSAMGGSSARERGKNGQLKLKRNPTSASSSPRALSLARTKAQTSSNSTRSTRQTPDIPALYSAPKIPMPEIPALYSAPEMNEVESASDQPKATTEVSMEEVEMDDSDFPEENSSEDYQYVASTEKMPFSSDPNQDEESLSDYQTDAPTATAKTNEDEQETDMDENTEDSYSSGYGDKSSAPSSQYGPPQSKYGPPQSQPSPVYGPPQPSPKSSMAPPRSSSSSGQGKPKTGDSMDKEKNPKRTMPKMISPMDQQQIENKMKPVSQMGPSRGGGAEGDLEPQSQYLPPVHTNQLEQAQQEEGTRNEDSSQYGADLGQYQQPPNPNYQTLPDSSSSQNGRNNGQTQQYSPSGGGYYHSSPPNMNGRPHDLTQPGRSPSSFPQQGQRGFGNGARNKPSTFYGPPGVNHLGSGNSQNRDEDELEGLNQKIVDAELLQRVQQIIEDHENQQKSMLDGIQTNNGKAGSSSGSGSGYSSPSGSFSPSSPSQLYSGNELDNPPTTGLSPPHSSYLPPTFDYGNSGNRNGPAPSTYYGPPAPFISTSSDQFSNGYSNSNSFHPERNSSSQSERSEPYQGQGAAGSEPGSSRREKNRSSQSSPPSQSRSPPGNNNSGRQEGRRESERNLSADIQYQKAILSTSFTESHPDPEYAKTNGGYETSSPVPGSSPSGRDFQQRFNNQLNSFAGPGQEYLPPPPPYNANQGKLQNPSYSNSQPSDHAQNGNSYSVKVGAGITVEGSKSPGLSTSYGPPTSLSSSLSEQQQGRGSGNSREFYSRQNESPSHSKGFSPAERGRNGESRFPSSVGTTPSFWSRNELPPEPQTRYGPPSRTSGSLSSSGSTSPGTSAPNQVGYSTTGVDNQIFGARPTQQFYSVPATNAPSAVTEPRPIYGIPLAPVISESELQNYSPGSSTGASPSTPYSFHQPETGKQSNSPNANYLPPSSGNYPSGQDLSNPFQLHSVASSALSSPNAPIYSVLGNVPSTSSAYMSIQGHNGNGNSHIYNINHNGYGKSSEPESSSSSRAASNVVLTRTWSNNGVDHASPIIPDISNLFTLPIYDYSPSLADPSTATHQHLQLLQQDLHAGASSPSSSSVVVPFEQFLQQLPPHHRSQMEALTSAQNLPQIIYGKASATAPQTSYRLSRRALSKQATVRATSTSKMSKRVSPTNKSTNAS